MEFQKESLLKAENIGAISLQDLLSLHAKNLKFAESFCDELKSAAVNKTQKTKAKKQARDILFDVKYLQNKELKEWHVTHPEYEQNQDPDGAHDNEDTDSSPEALLKHSRFSTEHENGVISGENVIINDENVIINDENVITNGENVIINGETAQEQVKPKRNRQKERKEKKKKELEELQKQAAEEAAALPDFKKQESHALAKRCLELKLEQQEIKADGHCLYHSVLDQLRERHSQDMFSSYDLPESFEYHSDRDGFYSNLSVKTLRHLNVCYLKKHRESYEFMLFSDTSDELQDFDEYCERMEHTAAWGGEVELSIFSNIFGCPIFVLQQNTEYTIGSGDHHTNPELKLVYYKHTFALGEHYGSLVDRKT